MEDWDCGYPSIDSSQHGFRFRKTYGSSVTFVLIVLFWIDPETFCRLMINAKEEEHGAIQALEGTSQTQILCLSLNVRQHVALQEI